MQKLKEKIMLFSKIGCIVLAMAIVITACSDEGNGYTKDGDTMDYSNIKNLYDQPLEVIQKCVAGKWKILEFSGGDFVGPMPYENSYVDIAKDTVIITMDVAVPSLPYNFSYKWEKKNISYTGENNMRYVMIYCEYPYAGWIFESIQNDTLFGCVYPTLGGNFKFLRTKSRE